MYHLSADGIFSRQILSKLITGFWNFSIYYTAFSMLLDVAVDV